MFPERFDLWPAAEGPRVPLVDDREAIFASRGGDNRQIAGAPFISPSTVKNHVSNILLKLQPGNRIEAAVYGVRAGMA